MIPARPPLYVIDGQTCSKFAQVSSTSCLQVLNFYGSESIAAISLWTNMVVGWFKMDVSWVFGVSLARLLG